jgi:predicted aspartyl protease
MAVDESDITELFEISEMQQILGSENTVGRQRRQSEGVYVKGKIHGIHGTFTIDTGASRTVLSEEIYFKIPETRRPPLTKSSILVGADGNPLVELGTAIKP